MGALEKFKSALKNINIVSQGSEEFIALLLQRQYEAELLVRESENDFRDAESDGLAKDEIEKPKAELQRREHALLGANEKVNVWKQEIIYRVAISCCMAFETFLIDFLIEQLKLDKEKVESYLLQALKKRIEHFEHLNVSVLLTEPFRNDDEIYECLPAKSGIPGLFMYAFPLVLSKKPFDNDFFRRNTVFATRDSRDAALQDIWLLFTIRNKIVHRDGKPDQAYNNELRSKGCEGRIDADLMQNYRDLKQTKPDGSSGGAKIFPSPEDVLKSKPVESSGKYVNKLGEIANALLLYACYIDEVCSDSRETSERAAERNGGPLGVGDGETSAAAAT